MGRIDDVLIAFKKGSSRMDGQLWLDWISRFIHIATAITLIGGSIFTAFILRPAAAGLESSAHEAFAVSVTGRWKRFVHIGILLFLLSGFYNYFRAMEHHQGDGLYHALLGIKMILALAVFFIASALVGRSAKLESLRQRRDLWLRVLILLAAIIVGISGFVKVRGGFVVPTESALTE